MTPEEEQFLRDHEYGVLGTGRRDGSPQMALVSYHYDGSDIVISTQSDRPQWHNVGRQPNVALLVQDGRTYVLVYGTAERLDTDPERLEATKRIPMFQRRMTQGVDDALIAAQLNVGKRVIIRITPNKVLKHD